MYLINGELVQELPFRIFLPNGTSRTSLCELSEAELIQLNVLQCEEIKPALTIDQYYGDPVIEINGTTATATYPVMNMTVEEIAERLTQRKLSKKAEIAADRYQKEISGVMGIRTDRDSQALLTGAVLQAVIDPDYTLIWKTNDGTFVSLSAEEIKSVGVVVRSHVQNCFNRESELCTAIDNATNITELNSIVWY